MVSKWLESQNKELVTVSKEKNFIERLVKICFAKYCSQGKRADYLFSVAK